MMSSPVSPEPEFESFEENNNTICDCIHLSKLLFYKLVTYRTVQIDHNFRSIFTECREEIAYFDIIQLTKDLSLTYSTQNSSVDEGDVDVKEDNKTNESKVISSADMGVGSVIFGSKSVRMYPR